MNKFLLATAIIVIGLLSYFVIANNDANKAPEVPKNDSALVSESEKSSSGFISPIKDAVYTQGDTLIIKWDPKLIDASTIYLSCLSMDSRCQSGQIYKRDDLSDPVSKNGSFSYNLDTADFPGEYRVVIYSFAKESKLESDSFKIKAPVGTLKVSSGSYYILDFYSSTSKYRAGKKVTFFADTREDDKTFANDVKSFRAKLEIVDANAPYGERFSITEGVFNKSTNLWEFETILPNDKSIVYAARVVLWCGYIGPNSVCAQQYGTSSQVEESIVFNLD